MKLAERAVVPLTNRDRSDRFTSSRSFPNDSSEMLRSADDSLTLQVVKIFLHDSSRIT